MSARVSRPCHAARVAGPSARLLHCSSVSIFLLFQLQIRDKILNLYIKFFLLCRKIRAGLGKSNGGMEISENVIEDIKGKQFYL